MGYNSVEVMAVTRNVPDYLLVRLNGRQAFLELGNYKMINNN